MIDIMPWSECERNFIKNIEKDSAKISSIIKTAELRLKDVKNKEATKENVSFIIESYYETIKELLTALLLKDSMRSKNHQCLISYFYKTYPKYEAESYLIAQLSFLRNRLNYYGELIEFEFYEKNKDEIEKIIKILSKLVKE